MNYERIYREFIADRLTKQPEKPAYFEKHHIIPKCKGGLNAAENMIRLTAEDHIHAHILLAKMYGGKMWGAALLMTKKTIGCKKTHVRLPTKDEIRAAAFSRKMFSLHCRGENHSQYGKKHTEASKSMMSKAHSERAKKGLMWTQNNQDKMSGVNHWTRQSKNAVALENAIPIFKANLVKAALANVGLNNPMHRPDVAEKVREAQKKHWRNGTGSASKEARGRNIKAHTTDLYRELARFRVLGDRNPMHGMGGSKNPNSRSILCVETGAVFGSVKDASDFCGGDVTKAARTGGKAGGYTWRRLTSHKSDGIETKKNGAKITNTMRPSAKVKKVAGATS